MLKKPPLCCAGVTLHSMTQSHERLRAAALEDLLTFYKTSADKQFDQPVLEEGCAIATPYSGNAAGTTSETLTYSLGTKRWPQTALQIRFPLLKELTNLQCITFGSLIVQFLPSSRLTKKGMRLQKWSSYGVSFGVSARQHHVSRESSSHHVPSLLHFFPFSSEKMSTTLQPCIFLVFGFI